MRTDRRDDRHRFSWARNVLRRRRQKLAQGRILDGNEAFWNIVATGKALMEQHLNYESAPEYPLEKQWTPSVEQSYYVTKMRLSKDRTSLFVNESLTLAGIPPVVFEYMLGDRCALEWIIDQYQITVDPRSGIVSNPNREDDPEYIVRLVGQVVTVSVETMRLVGEMTRRVHWEDFEWRGVESADGENLRSFWQQV